LLGKVENARESLGILAFDKWMCNVDARQAIFFRARLRDYLKPRTDTDAGDAPRTGFIAFMMDHGYVLDGPQWDFQDSPLHGLYHRTAVYQSVRGFDDFQPWLDRIIHFPEEVVDDACRRMQPLWIEGDEAALETALEALLRRRKRVPDL